MFILSSYNLLVWACTAASHVAPWGHKLPTLALEHEDVGKQKVKNEVRRLFSVQRVCFKFPDLKFK